MTKERIEQELKTLLNQKADTVLKLRTLEEQVKSGTTLLHGIEGAEAVLGNLLKELLLEQENTDG